MVESENAAQVFMASRFIVSPRRSFDREREFAKTIGTDVYKAFWTEKVIRASNGIGSDVLFSLNVAAIAPREQTNATPMSAPSQRASSPDHDVTGTAATA
jgi:hypothetical protein